MIRAKNKGSLFDDYLRDEGIYAEVTTTALKRVVAKRSERTVTEEQFSKAEMARRMRTKRGSSRPGRADRE